MLNDELVKYALIGLDSEIDKLSKSIIKGKQLLLEYEKGQKPKTPKTPQEIRDIIRNKEAEIEVLSKKKSDLIWKLTLAEDEK